MIVYKTGKTGICCPLCDVWSYENDWDDNCRSVHYHSCNYLFHINDDGYYFDTECDDAKLWFCDNCDEYIDDDNFPSFVNELACGQCDSTHDSDEDSAIECCK